jgi:hypothetical protein
MNDAFAVKVLSQMRDEWRVILPTLPAQAAERRRKYRKEIAAMSCAVRKLTGK